MGGGCSSFNFILLHNVLFVVIEFQNILPFYNRKENGREWEREREMIWSNDDDDNDDEDEKIDRYWKHAYYVAVLNTRTTNPAFILCILCMLLSVSIKFNLFVVFDFDAITVVYDCCCCLSLNEAEKCWCC